VRLTVTGVILLVVGGLLVTSSVWTLPLVIAGALMVVVAWVGGRLDGRFAIEWGEAGTQVEFRAEIKPAQSARPALARDGVARALAEEPEDADVVDGEAHTVEIEVAELRALIAAAETAETATPEADAAARATRNLRVANGGGRASEPAR
jgi:hypothetical protein